MQVLKNTFEQVSSFGAAFVRHVRGGGLGGGSNEEVDIVQGDDEELDI